MSEMQDQRKLRQEYLNRKRELRVELALGAAVLIFLAGVLLLCFCIFYLPYAKGKLPASFLTGGLLPCFLLFLPLSALGRWAWWAMKTATHAMANLPYVAPTTNLGSIPAEEILVRGSQEPPIVQSEVLLRAANEQETPKEELLRVSQE